MTTIRHRVVAAARHAGLRIADLARRIGVKAPTIHGGLSSERPTFKHLPRIAEICGVSVEWLRSGDPHQAPAWWGAYGETDVPATAARVMEEHVPTHLLERIRALEEEKSTALRERDVARARIATLEDEVADLTHTVTHQAVRLAKLHKAGDSAPETAVAG